MPSVDAHHSTENGKDKTVIVTNGENRHTRRFDKLDVMFIALINFALIADGLR
jgi:hypothetical protein